MLICTFAITTGSNTDLVIRIEQETCMEHQQKPDGGRGSQTRDRYTDIEGDLQGGGGGE